MHEVDVLLPIRNPHVEWLKSTLRSIEAQENCDLRIVVVLHPDDDAVVDLLTTCSRPYLIVWASRNGNLADALNTGLEACTAEFVARIDQDDFAEPLRIASQLSALRGDPNCVALGSCATVVDESDLAIGTRLVPVAAEDTLTEMRWKSAVMHPTVIFRREAVMTAGGYQPLADNVEDYELWLRLLRIGTIRSLSEPLLRYRVHANQVTQSRSICGAASAAVLSARLELARARGESLWAARVRHAVWNARQLSRRWRRRRR